MLRHAPWPPSYNLYTNPPAPQLITSPSNPPRAAQALPSHYYTTSSLLAYHVKQQPSTQPHKSFAFLLCVGLSACRCQPGCFRAAAAPGAAAAAASSSHGAGVWARPPSPGVALASPSVIPHHKRADRNMPSMTPQRPTSPAGSQAEGFCFSPKPTHQRLGPSKGRRGAGAPPTPKSAQSGSFAALSGTARALSGSDGSRSLRQRGFGRAQAGRPGARAAAGGEPSNLCYGAGRRHVASLKGVAPALAPSAGFLPPPLRHPAPLPQSHAARQRAAGCPP